MYAAKHLSLCLLVALPLFGCADAKMESDINPNVQSHPIARHYALYEKPNYAQTVELFNGYATGMPGSGYYQNLYLKERLWDGSFQVGFDKGIRTSSTGTAFVWKEGNYSYKFKGISELYYANYTETLCREGTVSWTLHTVKGAGWSDYSAVFCQIGPQQEWLPVR